MWRLCRNYFPTLARLQNRGINCPLNCMMCNHEDSYNLFFQCIVVVNVWRTDGVWPMKHGCGYGHQTWHRHWYVDIFNNLIKLHDSMSLYVSVLYRCRTWHVSDARIRLIWGEYVLLCGSLLSLLCSSLTTYKTELSFIFFNIPLHIKLNRLLL